MEQVKVVELRGGAFVESLLRHAVETFDPPDVAGGGLDGEDEDSAVGEGLPSGGEVGHVFDHEYAAGHGPRRFELAIGDDLLVQRRGSGSRQTGRPSSARTQ